MFRNFSPGLVAREQNGSPPADRELPAAGHEAPRGRWRRDRRPPEASQRVTAFQPAVCPKCSLMIRDQVAIKAGYCGRCQDFTLMCAAGRMLVNPDVTTQTSWHWPCTTPGTARWQVSQRRVALVVLLCGEHADELAAGRLSWVEQPTLMGVPPATTPR